MMFPLENMPAILRWLSEIIPAKWYMMAAKKIMIQGLGFSSVINEFLILSAMAVFFIVLSLKRFKYRLE